MQFGFSLGVNALRGGGGAATVDIGITASRTSITVGDGVTFSASDATVSALAVAMGIPARDVLELADWYWSASSNEDEDYEYAALDDLDYRGLTNAGYGRGPFWGHTYRTTGTHVATVSAVYNGVTHTGSVSITVAAETTTFPVDTTHTAVVAPTSGDFGDVGTYGLTGAQQYAWDTQRSTALAWAKGGTNRRLLFKRGGTYTLVAKHLIDSDTRYADWGAGEKPIIRRDASWVPAATALFEADSGSGTIERVTIRNLQFLGDYDPQNPNTYDGSDVATKDLDLELNGFNHKANVFHVTIDGCVFSGLSTGIGATGKPSTGRGQYLICSDTRFTKWGDYGVFLGMPDAGFVGCAVAQAIDALVDPTNSKGNFNASGQRNLADHGPMRLSQQYRGCINRCYSLSSTGWNGNVQPNFRLIQGVDVSQSVCVTEGHHINTARQIYSAAPPNADQPIAGAHACLLSAHNVHEINEAWTLNDTPQPFTSRGNVTYFGGAGVRGFDMQVWGPEGFGGFVAVGALDGASRVRNDTIIVADGRASYDLALVATNLAQETGLTGQRGSSLQISGTPAEVTFTGVRLPSFASAAGGWQLWTGSSSSGPWTAINTTPVHSVFTVDAEGTGIDLTVTFASARTNGEWIACCYTPTIDGAGAVFYDNNLSTGRGRELPTHNNIAWVVDGTWATIKPDPDGSTITASTLTSATLGVDHFGRPLTGSSLLTPDSGASSLGYAGVAVGAKGALRETETLAWIGFRDLTFSPTSIFGGSDVGDIWDFTDASLLSNGTGTPAHGDTIASATGLRGGGAATGAAGKRPLFQVVGSYAYVKPDGNDDLLLTTVPGDMAQPFTIWSFHHDYVGGSGNGGLFGNNSGVEVSAYYSGGNIAINAGTAFVSSFPRIKRVAMIATFNGASSEIWLNGQTATGDAGTNGLASAGLGLRLCGSSTQGVSGAKIFSQGLIKRAMTAAEKAKLGAWGYELMRATI